MVHVLSNIYFIVAAVMQSFQNNGRFTGRGSYNNDILEITC